MINSKSLLLIILFILISGCNETENKFLVKYEKLKESKLKLDSDIGRKMDLIYLANLNDYMKNLTSFEQFLLENSDNTKKLNDYLKENTEEMDLFCEEALITVTEQLEIKSSCIIEGINYCPEEIKYLKPLLSLFKHKIISIKDWWLNGSCKSIYSDKHE